MWLRSWFLNCHALHIVRADSSHHSPPAAISNVCLHYWIYHIVSQLLFLVLFQCFEPMQSLRMQAQNRAYFLRGHTQAWTPVFLQLPPTCSCCFNSCPVSGYFPQCSQSNHSKIQIWSCHLPVSNQPMTSIALRTKMEIISTTYNMIRRGPHAFSAFPETTHPVLCSSHTSLLAPLRCVTFLKIPGLEALTPLHVHASLCVGYTCLMYFIPSQLSYLCSKALPQESLLWPPPWKRNIFLL